MPRYLLMMTAQYFIGSENVIYTPLADWSSSTHTCMSEMGGQGQTNI